MSISAVVLTKNEEKNIQKCLESLRFCDEVIVVDDFSKDTTEKIALKIGAKVYKRKLDNDFSKQRNFGLSKAKGKWVLFVDADEWVSEKLAIEILKSVNDSAHKGFYLRRRDFFMGKEIKFGEQGKVKLLRLAQKNFGKWERCVHEVWKIEGSVGELKNPLLHNPHQNFKEFIDDINWMSALHAKANLSEGKKSNLAKIIFYPLGKFLYNFFLRQGFLDGSCGFLLAIFMSFHSFLAWSKLWFLQKTK